MSRSKHWFMAGSLAVLLLGVVMVPTSQGGDIGYVEQFALAKDRAAALKQLIPGTEDYYYYHCLHCMQTEQFEKIEPLTALWYERFRQTARLTEIQTRFALQMYDKQPEKSLAYIRNHMGLHFNHQREIVGANVNLPTTLDQKLISRETLQASSFARSSTLNYFENSSFEWLAAEKLTWEQRRELLSRLTRPDLPNLPQLIVEDLNAAHSGGFGSLAIHKMLTIAQMESVVKLKGDVLNTGAFVNAYVLKLHPGADENWKRDPKLTLAYLERLQAFATRLDPVHNPLKAHVLYHRLVFDRAQGTYDRA